MTLLGQILSYLITYAQVWNNLLASAAQKWSAKCDYQHGEPTAPSSDVDLSSLPYDTTTIGQNNIYINGYVVPAAKVTNGWFNFNKYYTYDNNSCSAPPSFGQISCGYYTQVTMALR